MGRSEGDECEQPDNSRVSETQHVGAEEGECRRDRERVADTAERGKADLPGRTVEGGVWWVSGNRAAAESKALKALTFSHTPPSGSLAVRPAVTVGGGTGSGKKRLLSGIWTKVHASGPDPTTERP